MTEIHGNQSPIQTGTGYQTQFAHNPPAQQPGADVSKAEQVAQQRELITSARAEAARTGDTELVALADQLERDYAAQERAVLADRVYDNPVGYDAVTGRPVFEPTPGWTRASELSVEELQSRYGLDPSTLPSDGSDFRAELFIPDPDVFGPDAQPVLTFRGSVTEQDWKNNFLQGAGQESGHYTQAMDAAVALRDTYGAGFETVGHSLGGGLAQAASAVTGVEATVFNAAGLHEATAARYVEANGGEVFDIQGSTTAYHVEGDILTSLQQSAGELDPAIADRVANLIKTTVGMNDNRILEQLGVGARLDDLRPLMNADGSDLRGLPEAAGEQIRLDAIGTGPDGSFQPRPDMMPLGGPDGVIANSEGALGFATTLTESIRALSTPGRIASDAGNLIDSGLDRLGQGAESGLDRFGGAASDAIQGAGQFVESGLGQVGTAGDWVLDGAGNLVDRGLTGAGQIANAGISGAGSIANRTLDGLSDVPLIGGLADGAGDLLESGANVIGNGVETIASGAGSVINWGADKAGDLFNGISSGIGSLFGRGADAAGDTVEAGSRALGDGIRVSTDVIGDAAGWTGDAIELANVAGATVIVGAGTLTGAAVGTGVAVELFGPGPVTVEALRQYQQFTRIADSIGEMGVRHGMNTVSSSLDSSITSREQALLQRMGG